MLYRLLPAGSCAASAATHRRYLRLVGFIIHLLPHRDTYRYSALLLFLPG